MAAGEDRRLVLKRCISALGISDPSELINFLDISYFDLSKHIFAQIGHTGPKVHLRGTCNSKRFIHVYLYWTICLGLQYPISDFILGNSWKHLESICEFGFEKENGHKKNAHQACLNPYHFKGDSSSDTQYIKPHSD